MRCAKSGEQMNMKYQRKNYFKSLIHEKNIKKGKIIYPEKIINKEQYIEEAEEMSKMHKKTQVRRLESATKEDNKRARVVRLEPWIVASSA